MSEKLTFEDVLGNDDEGVWEFLDAVDPVPEPDPTPEIDDEGGTDDTIEVPKVDTDDTIEVPDVDEPELEPGEGGEEPEVDGDDEGDENLAAYIASKWADSGLVSIPEGLDISSEEDLDKVIDHTIQSQIDAYKSKLSNVSQGFIDFVENGGNPADYIQVAAQKDYSEVEPGNEDSMIEVITEYYKDKGISSKRANTIIEAMQDTDELEDGFNEAKEYFKNKKEQSLEEMKAAQVAAREQREAQIAQRDEAIRQVIEESETINDFPIKSKKAKEELIDYMYKRDVKYVDEQGNSMMITQYHKDKLERQKDTKTSFMDIVFDALYTKNKGKLDPLKRTAVSKQSSKFKELSEQYKKQSTASKLSKGGGKSSRGGSSGKVTLDDWAKLD